MYALAATSVFLDTLYVLQGRGNIPPVDINDLGCPCLIYYKIK